MFPKQIFILSVLLPIHMTMSALAAESADDEWSHAAMASGQKESCSFDFRIAVVSSSPTNLSDLQPVGSYERTRRFFCTGFSGEKQGPLAVSFKGDACSFDTLHPVSPKDALKFRQLGLQVQSFSNTAGDKPIELIQNTINFDDQEPCESVLGVSTVNAAGFMEKGRGVNQGRVAVVTVQLSSCTPAKEDSQSAYPTICVLHGNLNITE